MSGGSFDTNDRKRLQPFAALAIENAGLHRRVWELEVEEERERISHEMHDGLAQLPGLTVIMPRIHPVSKQLGCPIRIEGFGSEREPTAPSYL